jgi:MoxR-like ATPase
MVNISSLIRNVEKVIVGKTEAVELAVACLLAGGNLLIEDVPGTGKTTLALAVARSIQASFARIQFTADLLPTDITGVSVYNQGNSDFEFRRGPIFNHVVLADEINRGTPRVQSGLLEAMNERQVSVDGTTYDLPAPFFVIATQNPLTFAGTYPLLAAQLDRFLVKLKLGYLQPEEEIAMLHQQRIAHPLDQLTAVMTVDELLALQKQTREITVDDTIYRYIIALVHATRNSPEIRYGISHRGSLALFNAVRAYAMVQERAYVIPDDVKKMALPVLAHRLVQTSDHRGHEFAEQLITRLLETVPVPL